MSNNPFAGGDHDENLKELMQDMNDDEIVECYLDDEEVNYHINWEEKLKERIELLRKLHATWVM